MEYLFRYKGSASKKLHLIASQTSLNAVDKDKILQSLHLMCLARFAKKIKIYKLVLRFLINSIAIKEIFIT
jgi:hypothetical protein